MLLMTQGPDMRERSDSAGQTQSEAMVHGWCPSAWRPMMAGDGLIVRVRPALARLTAAQASGLGAAAADYGNGAIDLTNRAGLQIRGVTESGLAGLHDRLVALGLIAADPAVEGRPAILVAPDWTADDGTEAIVTDLAGRLDELPTLPGKVGFAIDVTGAPLLPQASADFRVERTAAGDFLVRADGRENGVAVAEAMVVDTLLALARWFHESGGHEAGRMARHRASLPPALMGDVAPAPARALTSHGNPIYGVPFGRMAMDDLAALLQATGSAALRVTPWRRLIAEGARARPVEGFLLNPSDRALRVDACVGAPACPQATVETRALASRLSPLVVGSLHVSGCAKGCARSAAADIVLTGRAGAFDLAFDARAGAASVRAAMTPTHILSLLGAA